MTELFLVQGAVRSLRLHRDEEATVESQTRIVEAKSADEAAQKFEKHFSAKSIPHEDSCSVVRGSIDVFPVIR